MSRRWRTTAILLLLASAVAGGRARSAASAWQDPSPHEVHRVTVADGVQLEVLDWGGKGRPVVLLTGSGHSAHVYDDLAPKLTDDGHVYGITRRGYGSSSLPEAGYDEERLAADILAVLDHLKIDAPVLAGHSMAGGELTTFARLHPTRVAALIYIDAQRDPTDASGSDPAYRELIRKLPPPPPCENDRSSFAAFRTSRSCGLPGTLPEAELRAVFEANADGSVGRHKTPRWVHEAIGAGHRKRDYSTIRVPVLVLYDFPRPPGDPAAPADDRPLTDEERANATAFATATRAIIERSVETLERQAPQARSVVMAGAGHHMFLTREADVLRELRTFLRSLE